MLVTISEARLRKGDKLGNSPFTFRCCRRFDFRYRCPKGSYNIIRSSVWFSSHALQARQYTIENGEEPMIAFSAKHINRTNYVVSSETMGQCSKKISSHSHFG